MRSDVQAYLSHVNGITGPRLHQMPVPLARRIVRKLARAADLPIGPIATDRAFLIDTGTTNPIQLRLFESRARREPGPIMVYFHGGGWLLGDTEIYAPVCAEIARQLDLPVISVEYRRAPEWKSPAGARDCEAAARWVAANGDKVPGGAAGLILAGDSCGGAYAISTAMALRDRPAAVPVIAQLAFYPSADLATRHASFKAFATGYLLDKNLMRWFAENFAPDDSDYRASPMAGDLAGLPPALVVTAELDPLRDQGRAYAAALARAGVPVNFQEAKGMIHGFTTLRRAIPSAAADLASALAALGALIRLHPSQPD